MEGHRIKEKSLKTVLATDDIRLEAEYYISDTISFDCIKGKDIEVFSQYGTSKDLNEEHLGYPVLRLNEFDSFFISKPAKSCNLIDKETYESLRLLKDDVLICRTNGNPRYVGKAALVPKDYEYAFASYLYRVRPKRDIINSATLVTFLNSKYGRKEIERYAMVGNQTNFSPAKFRQISIPRFSKKTNDEIEDIVYTAFNLSEKGKELYVGAENVLSSELGVKEFLLDGKAFNIKQIKESFLKTGRLDAEYYLPKYELLRNSLSAYKNGIYYLSDIASTYRGNFIPDIFYCDETPSCRKYIRGADISSNQLIEDKVVFISNEYKQKNEILCKKDDIVFAMIGSVGTAALVTDEFVGSYASNNLGIIRLKDSNIKAEYLHLLLTSPFIGALLFEQKEMRTAQPKLSDKDIWDFPIPKLSKDVQQTIADYVQKSVSLRQQAKQLLEDAKLMVEKEIQKGK